MRHEKIRKMISVALLMALVVVMQFISGMIPPIGGFSFSLVLIPIVIGAAVFGPATGAFLGATFGVIVAINCITGSDIGGHMVFQANPLLCCLVVVGKGALAGLAAGLVYKLVAKKNTYVGMLLSAIVCPVINTGVFLACMGLFFADILSAWASGSNVLGYVLSGIVLANFVPELIINIVFGLVGQRVVNTVSHK